MSTRLTKEQLEARGLVLSGMVDQEATIAALRAENERLKEALKAAKTWLTGWASAEKELAIIDAALKSGDIRAALPAETGTPLEKHGISEE